MDVPQFGEPAPACRPRPSAYAVVRDAEDRVLCVRAEGGLHLPGGGIGRVERTGDAFRFVEDGA